MARENETWGYTRIRGALQNLGHEIGRNTIKRILQEHGIDPAPERGKRMPWSKFIKAHLCEFVGIDFFAEKVARLFGLVHRHVLFGICIASRSAEVAGIGQDQIGGWTGQMTRNTGEMDNERMLGKRNVLWDPDLRCTNAFRRMLEASGAKVVHWPRGRPSLEARVERFVPSSKNEYLEAILPVANVLVSRGLEGCVPHYHRSETSGGLERKLEVLPGGRTVACRHRTGRLINYHRGRSDTTARFWHQTGYAPTQRVELAMRKGLIWLTKPCTGEALAKAVHAALSNDAAF
jgi:hypothetical protein